MSEYPWDIENMMLAQHEQPCDCAICDEIHFNRETRRNNRKSNDNGNQAWMRCTGANYPAHAEAIIGELRRKLTATENALTQCLSDIEGYKMRVENLSEDVEKWKHACNEMANAYSSMVLQLDEFKKDYGKLGVELQDMREAYNDEFEQHHHTFANLNALKAKCNIYNCMDRKDLKLRIEQLEKQLSQRDL